MTAGPERRAGPSRRDTLAMAGAATAALMMPLSPARADALKIAGSLTLAEAARSRGLIYGAAGGNELFTDVAYRTLMIKQAAILTPENALKFDALQPEQGRFNFGPGDALVDGARKAGLMARGHALFWNDWPPAWLKTLSHAEIERVFEAHLETVVPHFAGRLQSWDVVNEPFWLGKDRPGTFRPGPWYDALGIDYIFRAFRRTAALDGTAKLVVNEAWTERNDPVGLAVRRSLLKLIDRMQDKGLKLDAIGLQGHLTPQIPYDDAGFVDFLHEIASRKLDIYITEFDVDDVDYPTSDAGDDAAVAARARAFLGTILKVPAVKMVVTWGLSDRYSWWRDPDVMAANGMDKLPRPLPYDDLLAKKPMWTAMAEAFRARG